MIPYDKFMPPVDLGDGRVATVVMHHHASPAERWQMWRTLRQTAQTMDLPFRKRLLLNWRFFITVMNPDCEACWYEVSDEPASEA